MQGNPLLIPHPAIVRALNAQRVVSRGQGRESSHPVIGVHPVPGMIERLEHVPILVPLRIHVAQSGELEGERMVLLVRQCQRLRKRDGLCEQRARAGRHRHGSRNENPVRTTGGMDGFSTICSGQNDVSPLLLPKNI